MPSVTKAQLLAENQALRKSLENESAIRQELEQKLAEALEQLQDKNRALTEAHAQVTAALAQQTATSEILRVISSSPTDVQPVFDAIVRSALRLMNGRTALVLRLADEQLHIAAVTSTRDVADAAVRADFPVSIHGAGVVTHTMRTQRPYIVADVETDSLAGENMRRTARLRGYRSALVVPMVRESRVIGCILVTRQVAGAFSADDIALLQTFADQAMIAIENVRLFKELEARNRDLTESLERETATGEILRVISSSPTDIHPVLVAILDSGRRLCEAEFGAIFRFEDGVFVNAASTTVTSEFGAWLQKTPIQPGPGTPLRRAGIERRPVQVADILSDPDFAPPDEYRREGMRTAMAVPMLKDGALLGALTFHRRVVKPFTDQQIALLQTFADQAVIAIENVRLFKELEARNRDLTEALEQQTATSEILRVISQSQTDVQPVFDAIVRNGVRLCDGTMSMLVGYDGTTMNVLAMRNIGSAGSDALRRALSTPPTRASNAGRAILDRTIIHVPDVFSDAAYGLKDVAEVAGYRSALVVPLLREGVAIGAIVIGGRHATPFSASQIELLKTFADQAVIAIENVRLFKELEARNRELTESLEQQTATSEILRVISSSPTDLQPVMDAVAENAARLCGADDAVIRRIEGDTLRLVARFGSMPAPDPIRPISRDYPAGLAVIERRTIHIDDISPRLETEFPRVSLGLRTVLATPLLREGVPIGAIVIRRAEMQPFTKRQIELLETFADQAVIAIENVRLFTELQQKNEALTQAHAQVTEALDQQTATSEVLKVISRSTFDLQPVLDTLVENAVRLCGANTGLIWRFGGEVFRLTAHYGLSDEVRDFWERNPHRPGRGSLTGRTALERRPIHIPDVLVDPEYQLTEGQRVGRYRTLLGIPMLREGALLGVFSLERTEPKPFTDKQIELVTTFADQAVIAIENVRLFKELEARTQDLTRSVGELRALGEVGQAISSTLDLQTVLSTIVAWATQLSGTDAGVIYEYDEQREVFVPRATEHLAAEIVETMLATPVRKGEGATGRLAEAQEPIQVPDVLEAPVESRVRGALVRAGYRALLAVPLLREGHLIGGLTVIRKATGAFAPEVIELLRTFATQSSLAIQNARLFLEIEDKSRQLEAASRHKSEFLANMSHELRTPLNAIIGFSDVLTERMFGELNDKQDEYVKDISASGTHLLSLINDILDLSKIEAGRMELEVTEFDLPQAIDNALTLVRERAGRRGIALNQAVDERLGQVRGDERKVKQVLLNLLSNALKFTPEGGRIDVRAGIIDGTAEVSVTDTGVGIAPEDQEAVFEEFRQVGGAEKKAEGTGLGLTLCRKFVELHGGRIWVKSQVGTGSTFTFALPLQPSIPTDSDALPRA
jgi:GAF domain-containing protein